MSTTPHAGKIAMAFEGAPTDAPMSRVIPRQFSAVVAVDDECGIGKDGAIPWRSSVDMAHFKTVTTKASKDKVNAVIMGVKTYTSIPAKFRPLPDRINIVLAPDAARPFTPEEDGVVVMACGLYECLERLGTPNHGLPTSPERVFVIGGASLYNDALFSPKCRPLLQSLYVTRVRGSFGCTAKIALPEGKKDIAEGLELESAKEEADGDLKLAIETYSLPNREERQYLDLIRTILETGCTKGDRTGTGTISLFGAQMRFSLRDGTLPLLTTKRVFYRGVLEELLWFLRADTDADHLAQKGVHIWDANGSREFLDSRGLKDNRVNDLGPVYGFQWRHFGAEYTNCDADYNGKGYDQIRQVIQTLRKDPNDRRMIVSAWNPAALQHMALPPCHMLAQFYVNDRKELSCMLYQRSCDMGLGVPFNIASYALLTAIIAKATGLGMGDFVHTLGDAHVYLNHVDALKQQLERTPRAFPKLAVTKDREFLEDFTIEDFELRDYFPHPTIKMDMAV
eukprot:CAMPEP_0174842900 /NCGR_PEP_ID=MMETSP1114-20130205/10188_1 /TAXON_ID=312471 /ORGANISM="Neobodo designis, Strain CCAP 1951/1" /LENGTH=508 /DNA_ID=CAMNT_0016077111 /DNA_START=124 /DNA_END=1650 /DNA_ORIENTATION=+